MLTTLATVKSWLGITDDDSDTKLAALIAGVDEQVKRYCARNFEQTTVVYKDFLDLAEDITLDETPVTEILYSATGNSTALELTYSGAMASARVYTKRTGAGFLTLVAGSVATEIELEVIDTLSDLETLIESETGWSADVTSGYESYPALSLLDQQSLTVESGESFEMYAALSPVPLTKLSEGVYAVSVTRPHYQPYPTQSRSSGSIVVVYTGGYDTDEDNYEIPAGLTLIVNKICCDAWRNFSNNAQMQSESIGDYSYSKGPEAMIASSIGPYMTALDLYKRV